MRTRHAIVMPALGASKDARERACGAGIHVFLFFEKDKKTWMAGTSPAMTMW